jgi:hypothetical protein
MAYQVDNKHSGFARMRQPLGLFGFDDSTAPFNGDLTLQQWAVKLSLEWAKRTNKPSKEFENRLDSDFKQTLAKAAARGKGKFLKAYGTAAIIRAWQTREEQKMEFETLEKTKRLANFKPPPVHSVQLVKTPLVKDGGEKDATVAPLVAAFMQKLLQLYPKASATTYYSPPHGSLGFEGRGFSIDLWLHNSPKDARGFWRREDAVDFLRAVHQAARAVGAEWRVIYNDYSVARIINQETGARHVVILGFHGPHPLVLHFHLDLAPQQGVIASVPNPIVSSPSQSEVSKPSGSSSNTSLPKLLVDAYKSGILTLAVVFRILAGDRDLNGLTNSVFYTRHPEREGKPLRRGEPQFEKLSKEWLKTRNSLRRILTTHSGSS